MIGNMSASIRTQWRRRDGQPINSRHYPAGNKLQINDADKEDEGIYVCQGMDNRGTTIFEFNANLIIQGKRNDIIYHNLYPSIHAAMPKVRLDPQQQVVRPGDSPQIECQIIEGDQPMRIDWFRETESGEGPLPTPVTQRDSILQV